MIRCVLQDADGDFFVRYRRNKFDLDENEVSGDVEDAMVFCVSLEGSGLTVNPMLPFDCEGFAIRAVRTEVI